MKRTIAAVALLCLGGAAAAQSVQIYGILDAGIERIDHIGAERDSVTRVSNLTGGQFPSRIGFRGTEALGDGLSAVFTLESGIALDTGSLLQSGRLFGRQAFVGLQNQWGTLSIGRQWTMAFYALLDADVIGPASLSMYVFDTYPPNARADNSLAYRGTFNGFTLGTHYSAGRDTLAPGDCAGEKSGRACTGWSAMGKYDSPQGWGLALAYDEQRGGGGGFSVIPGRPPIAAGRAEDEDQRTILDGYIKFGNAKLGAGWIKREIKAATRVSTDLYFAGINYTLAGPMSIDAQYSALRNSDMNADAGMAVVRLNYFLSKRTSAYALLGHMSNCGTASYSVSVSTPVPASPLAGTGQNGLMVGMRHLF